MSVHVLYATKVTATGGRDGRATTTDGSLDLTLTTPTELGGSGGPGNNPEQLFAAGYAACFLGAMRFVASQGGPKVPEDARVTATVGIGPRSQGGFGLDVHSTLRCPAWHRPMPMRWCSERISPARIPTPSATTFPCGWSSPEHEEPACPAVTTGFHLD